MLRTRRELSTSHAHASWLDVLCQWATAALCLALTALAACGGGGSAPPLADLHLPHVTKVPGIASLLARQHMYTVPPLATVQAPGGSGPDQILFLAGTTLLDVVALDGSATRFVHLTLPCNDNTSPYPSSSIALVLSVAPDGRSAVCQTPGGIESFPLQGIAAGQGHMVVTATTGDPVRTPLMLADGQHLAVVSHAGGGCSISLYALMPGPMAHLQTVLVFPEFVVHAGSGETCGIGALSSSPDGTWLTLSSGVTLYGLRLAALGLPVEQGSESASRALTISLAQLVVLGQAKNFIPPSWRGHSSMFTFVSEDEQTLQQATVPSGQPSTLLTQSAGYLCALAWEPDGSVLVFGLCGSTLGDYTPPTPQIYRYTPSN